MLGANSTSVRLLRCGFLGIATVSTLLVSFTDTADARRGRHRHQAARQSYSPAFASIIVDGNSGATLQAKDADSTRHPASLTKIMTLYLLFERLENGKLKLDSTMDVSENASEQAPTKLGLRPGQSIRVEDAIKGLVTRSANDAAVVIAESLAGTEEEFAKVMTRKARALGMSKTTYVNASGLPDSDQITTARDQATLGRAIQDRFPTYYRYFATDAFNYKGRVIRNHNRLLGRMEGVDGIKTGYTRASGFNLVTSMKRGNRFLVGVVLGGRSGGSRDAIMRNLLAEHLDDAATRRTVAAITERNGGDVAVAEARPAKAQAAAAPMIQVQGAVQTADAEPDPVPPPAPRAPSLAAKMTAPAKPAPMQLTSGVISTSSLAAIPGGDEPMTPVRVRTVQVRTGVAKIASATPAPIATSALPQVRNPVVAETSKNVVAKAEKLVEARTAPAFPAPLPSPPARSTYGTGTGTLGVVPSSSSTMNHASAMAYADPQRGAPSSTLGQQAHAMQTASADETVALPPTLVKATEPPQTIQQNGAIKPVIHSGWIIQVGALESEAEARARLDAARGSAKGLLGRANPFTEQVTGKGDKTLYRARFAGLDKNSAEQACRALKRSDISCFAVKN